MGLSYVQGDLFAGIPKDEKVIIPHCCNNLGLWGKGFVVPLGKNFPSAKGKYLAGFDKELLFLGSTQMVETEDENVVVANMIGQDGVVSKENTRPLDYEAIYCCMSVVLDYAKEHSINKIISPKFGSALAGGDWTILEAMIQKLWVKNGLDVIVYYL